MITVIKNLVLKDCKKLRKIIYYNLESSSIQLGESMRTMKYNSLFRLAKPYLEKNEFRIGHTQRVFNIALENFDIPSEKEELILCSIILHDIGGSNIKKQYEEGPKIAKSILIKLGYDENFIHDVCDIIKTHHDHPKYPLLSFRILYDSDKLVMFSPEEFSYYNSKPNFNWNKIIDQMYSNNAKDLAKNLLKKRRTEITYS